MHVRLLLLDLREPSHFLSALFPGHPVREETTSLALDLFLERDLRAGKKAHGHVWSPTAAKPPVIEWLNCADTSLSPTFALDNTTRPNATRALLRIASRQRRQI